MQTLEERWFMNRMIFQVSVGKPSKLYEHCIESVAHYCEKYGIEHIVLTQPKLRIKPDIFSSGRSEESYMKYGGYLPIYEKENAFEYLDNYDQIAIVDADIYIRPDAPNIFDEFGTNHAFGAVCEREMDIQPWYENKIKNYSQMQYSKLHNSGDTLNFHPNQLGYEFFNMGMILLNSELFKPYLKGQDPHSFINRMEFKDFVDGVGAYKWSTDQTLLNYFLKRYQIPTKHMDGKWNGLYSAVNNLKECYFVHFFLKDKLPNGGENVKELMDEI